MLKIIQSLQNGGLFNGVYDWLGTRQLCGLINFLKFSFHRTKIETYWIELANINKTTISRLWKVNIIHWFGKFAQTLISRARTTMQTIFLNDEILEMKNCTANIHAPKGSQWGNE